jgi:Spy/CpxP family protein refolding chaperone
VHEKLEIALQATQGPRFLGHYKEAIFMKIKIQPLALGLIMTALTSAAFAQTSDTQPPPGTAAGQPPAWRHGGDGEGPGDHHGWRGHGPGLMGSFRELGLSDAQREQIHTILSAERAQMKANAPSVRATMVTLENPGDPGFAAAVQAAKTQAAERIQHRSDLEVQLYNVLTPEQKTQFAQILATKQARWQQRAAERGNPPPPPAQ